MLPYARAILLAGVTTVLVLVYVYRFEGYSRGVFAIHVIVLGVMVIGARLSFRGLGEFVDRHRATGRRTIIYGAGDAGALALREIQGNPRRGCQVVGFVDDDAHLESDVVFGVTRALVGDFRRVETADGGEEWALDYRFVMQPGESRLPVPPIK